MWPATIWYWRLLTSAANSYVQSQKCRVPRIMSVRSVGICRRAQEEPMSWQIWILAIVIAVFAAVQYTLAWRAIADLLHRPRVRGNSHTFWALVILCMPVIGALAYGAVGPTSFRSTQVVGGRADQPLSEASTSSERPVNVTPFRPSAGRLSDQIEPTRPGVTRSRAHGQQGAVSRLRRPGA